MASSLSEKQLLVVIALVGLYVFWQSQTTEGFTDIKSLFAPPLVTREDYAREVRNLAEGTVGPYIGDIYLYLRAKGFDPVTGTASIPMYAPTSVADPSLNDEKLEVARLQVKGWIDSAKARWKQSFPAELMASMDPIWKLDYAESTNGKLIITYTDNGITSQHFL